MSMLSTKRLAVAVAATASALMLLSAPSIGSVETHSRPKAAALQPASDDIPTRVKCDSKSGISLCVRWYKPVRRAEAVVHNNRSVFMEMQLVLRKDSVDGWYERQIKRIAPGGKLTVTRTNVAVGTDLVGLTNLTSQSLIPPLVGVELEAG